MAKIVTKVGIEENGKVIIPPGELEEIEPIVFDSGEVSDKLFKVKDNEGYHILIVDEKIDEGYDLYGPIYRLASINKNCIVVSDYSERHGEKWSILRTDSLEDLTNYTHDLITPINENMYMTKKDGLYGVIDKDGTEILTNMFAEIIYNDSNDTFTAKLYKNIN